MNAMPKGVLAVMERAIDMLAGFDDADHADDGDEPIVAPMLAEVREARAAMAELIKRGNRIEQRNRGAIWGDEDAVAQDWAEFRAALTRVQGSTVIERH